MPEPVTMGAGYVVFTGVLAIGAGVTGYFMRKEKRKKESEDRLNKNDCDENDKKETGKPAKPPIIQPLELATMQMRLSLECAKNNSIFRA